VSGRHLALIAALAAGLIAAPGGVGASQVAGRQSQVPPPPSRDPNAQPIKDSGVIAGMLVMADSGRAVRRARVSLSASESRVSRSVTTDDAGRFSFAELPAGRYTLSASKAGLLDVTYGQKRPGSGRPGTPIQLAAGERRDSIKLGIPRGAVITGVVVDEQGEPAFGVSVRALRYVMRSGERTLVGAGQASTDDRGIYRITSLLPGEYVVMAAARPDPEAAMAEELKVRAAALAELEVRLAAVTEFRARAIVAPESTTALSTGYASIYYPGTVQMSAATSIKVDVSEERSSVDLQMQLVPMAKVSGVILPGEGGLPPAVDVRLIDHGVSIPGMNMRSTRTTPKGEFSFSEVPPGNYTLVARATVRGAGGQAYEEAFFAKNVEIQLAGEGGRAVRYFAEQPSGGQALWAMADVSVAGQDLANLGLTLQRGMAVAGSVALETPPANPADITRIRVSLVAAGQTMTAVDPPPAQVDASGRFTLRGVMPGKYRLSAAGAPAGLVLESAVFGGVDALDLMLEVKPGDDVNGGVLTFASSSKATELSGAIQDPSGQPTSDYTIIVFTAEERFWTPQSRRIQAVRPATDGRFAFRGLPSGEYRMIAVTDVEPGQWFDPAFLRELVASSFPLRLAEGERKVQDVRVR
jgi:protocatechuate 3,4-dioxygenase beta subunit